MHVMNVLQVKVSGQTVSRVSVVSFVGGRACNERLAVGQGINRKHCYGFSVGFAR